MNIRIEDNRIVGKMTKSGQFLHGSPDCKGYQITVDFTGADIETLVKNAFDNGIIKLRKRIKTKAQAERLEKGITFAEMVSAAPPKDPNQVAASLDTDALDDEVRERLIKKLMGERNGDNTNHVV